MESSEVRPLPPPVAELRQRIEQWRSTRAKRGPMPRDLWEEAARQARRRGVYAISKALRLNYEALKGWSEDSPPKRHRTAARKAVSRQTFVRFDPLPGITSPSPGIEVEIPEGPKLRIGLSGVNLTDALAIVDAFLRIRR